jgi:glucosamine--fructose-6-phosphate aminotransferase (isomerizing)
MGVHNGIVENFLPLKESLLKEGVVFESDTDTEVMMHLLDQAVGKYLTSTPPDALTPSDLPGLLLPVFKSLEGSFACALLFAPFPHVVVCYRQGTSPLVVGYGEGETFFGSDALSLAGLSDSLVYLEDGDTALLTPEGVRLWDRYGAPVQRSPVPNPIASGPVTKEGYPHFMAKEIHQQPLMLTHILDQYVSVAEAGARSGASVTFNPALSVQRPAALRLVGCGTAYYAGLVAASWFERYARLSPHVEIASEFRYRRPPLDRAGMYSCTPSNLAVVGSLPAIVIREEDPGLSYI